MDENPLRALEQLGQSVWLDYIRRDLVASGELARLVAEDGLKGVTSNPTIFEKAIRGSAEYDAEIAEARAEAPDLGVEELFERLAVTDIRMAADVLRPVWEHTAGGDGFVSLEVSPHLAHETEGTLAQVRHLWRAVDRPNLMIKIPATAEGIPAIRRAIAEGMNINVTLMFSLAHYEAVAAAYIAGLDECAAPARVASVASFFVSRVDGKVDPLLERIGSAEALALRGKASVANAKLAYRRFREVFHGPAFGALRGRGARVQRVLWGSTSTKNPAYRDVLYVEELIGPETVNTVPPETLDAFRDHGRPRPSLLEEVDEARRHLDRLEELGIDLAAITEDLQRDGVEKFAASHDSLLATLEAKRDAVAARVEATG